ncbi:transposase [Catalinimonas alkaloidigena]|uniref:IS66 family transposase n=1 Tax=Catalinimonas alkaloidigena TaxID=1075417 RepID=UPI0024076118|nr:IS66 family transposase [Catalinimonas alkaloidigena]MDF9799228.1 transposase [Catalinimonas alkaloidigena]
MSSSSLQDELALLQQEKQRLLAENQLLKDELAELKRLIFGSKRERFVPAQKDDAQLSLELATETTDEEQAVVKQTVSYQRAVKQAGKKPVRQSFPDHLPRIDVVLEPEEDVSTMRKIGEEVTEELDLEPARLFVRRYIRPRYVCAEESFHIAELPARPIEKGIPGPGLLAQIIVDKFVYHLPFYRQAQRYERMGMKIPSSTLNSWLPAACNLLEPLYLALKFEVLKSTYLQADETPIPVLDKQKKKTHQGYHWVYHAPEKKLVLFDYQKGRNREGPKQMLKDYQGYLQTDGYQAYEQFEDRENIILVGCLAHARRYFEHAKDSDPVRSEQVLLLIQQLYAVEREAREQNLDPEDRYSLRQEKSVPVMDALGQWLVNEYPTVLPKSKIGKAFYYLIARYNKIYIYLQDGRLEVDNNLIENSIRPVALGRKNYLFAGSHSGAEKAAIVYSLLGSCKLQNINPYDYLQDVLKRLPEHPVNQLHELLPPNWKPAKVNTEVKI